jgi:hypothetical protein
MTLPLPYPFVKDFYMKTRIYVSKFDNPSRVQYLYSLSIAVFRGFLRIACN